MKKILIDEATVKLALGALNTTESDCGSRAWEREQEAITTLQEALANEALDKMAENAIELGLDYEPAQQEPCGWQFYQDGKWHHGMETNNHRANTEAAGVPVRDVYPSPQPAQREPVAWAVYEADGTHHNKPCQYPKCSYPCPDLPDCRDAEPAQRTWVGLTTKEIREWWASENGLEDCGMAKWDDFEQVVRAIEAAHGIKENT